MFHSTILFVCLLAFVLISASMARTDCSPVCLVYCPYGNVLDINGCPICICKTNPCKNGQEPLKDVSCRPRPSRKKCPRAYRCVPEPNSARGVCCPRRRWML